MKKMIIFFMIGLFAINSYAKVNEKKIKDWVDLVSKLTQEKYLFKGDLGEVKQKVKFPSKGIDADLFLSQLLNLHDYTRVPVSKGVYKIMKVKDFTLSRGIVIDQIKPMLTIKEEIPKNYDYINLKVKIDDLDPREVTKKLRTSVSKYGRIFYDRKKKNIIVITDTGLNCHKMLQYIKKMDRKK